MDPDAIRTFVGRDWQALERSKRQYWARELGEGGPSAALAVWWVLWQHLRAVRPDWPDDAQRAEDLAHHAELARKFGIAARVLAAR